MPRDQRGREPITLDPRVSARLEEKKARLDVQRPLAPAIARRLHEDLRIRLTYDSNALEGNTLSLRETQVIVEDGITIGGHSLREHLEATNHASAFDTVLALVERNVPITVETILRLHAFVLHDVHETAVQVPALMHEWATWLERDGLNDHPVVRAAISHHGFVAVHPFLDGNGRTARLLLNLQLLRDGYAPAFVLREWKLRYLQGLAAADSGNYQSLVHLMGQAVEAGLDCYLEACAAIPDEHYQRLSGLALQNGYDVNYLGLLARSGKLEARKWDRQWYSTPAALARYEAEVQREPRGRPPRP